LQKRLKGRAAVVTGAGRGIGREVAQALAAVGAHVVVNDPGVAVDGAGFDQGPAALVVNEIEGAGGIAVANNDSVATSEGGERIISHCVDAFGSVDILVNCAGILRDRMIFNMSEEEWDAVIQVHLKGHFNTIRPASVLMRRQGHGRIVNFSSGSGLRGVPGQANYGAAKAAIGGLTRVVARDLGRYGVTCNALAPIAATRMIGTAAAALQDRVRDAAAGLEPSPEAVAPLVVFLCTDDAWNVNGKIFGITGGLLSLVHDEVPVRVLEKFGRWTLQELVAAVPTQLMVGVANPAAAASAPAAS
jgi:NAD(P)-dependent dehydrogenase (short-subunit alcohol dehydrogenase family)